MKYLIFSVKVLLGIAIGILLLQRMATTFTSNSSFAPSGKAYSVPLPKLVLLKSHVDLGTIAPESNARASFPVQNTGNGRLILYRANSDCGCVISDTLPIVVGPGEVQNLIVELPHDRPAGNWTLTTNYQTNDPAQPMLTLTCKTH